MKRAKDADQQVCGATLLRFWRFPIRRAKLAEVERPCQDAANDQRPYQEADRLPPISCSAPDDRDADHICILNAHSLKSPSQWGPGKH